MSRGWRIQQHGSGIQPYCVFITRCRVTHGERLSSVFCKHARAISACLSDVELPGPPLTCRARAVEGAEDTSLDPAAATPSTGTGLRRRRRFLCRRHTNSASTASVITTDMQWRGKSDGLVLYSNHG